MNTVDEVQTLLSAWSSITNMMSANLVFVGEEVMLRIVIAARLTRTTSTHRASLHRAVNNRRVRELIIALTSLGIRCCIVDDLIERNVERQKISRSHRVKEYILEYVLRFDVQK